MKHIRQPKDPAMAEIWTTHLMTLKLAVNGSGSRPPEGPVHDIVEVL